MAKIGNEYYPKLGFSDAVKDLRTFYEKLKGKASSTKSLAEALGHSENSGWFKVKTADLRAYGLIEGRGEYKITEIGQDILFFNNQEEYQRALKMVLDLIPLFKKIYERTGKEANDLSNFKAILTDITNAEKGEISNKVEQIRNVYIDLVTNLNEEREVKSNKEIEANKTIPKDSKDMIKGEIADVYIQMPRKKESIVIARTILKALESQITGEELTEE